MAVIVTLVFSMLGAPSATAADTIASPDSTELAVPFASEAPETGQEPESAVPYYISNIRDGATIERGATWSVTVSPEPESVELWADGGRLAEFSAGPFETTLDLAAGEHLIGICATFGGARVCAEGGVAARITVTESTPTAKPTPPVGLTATVVDDGVLLTWQANPASEQVDLYQVYISEAGADWADFDLGVKGRSYLVTRDLNGSLDPSRSYSFRVSAHNAVGYGDWGNVAEVAVRDEPDDPPSPRSPGTTVEIERFSDLEAVWNPEFTRPPVPGGSGGGGIWEIDTPYGPGFRFVASGQMQTPGTVTKHILARALITDPTEGRRQVSRFNFMLPAAGNPDGIMRRWHAGTFWEIGHTTRASGHNIKVDGKFGGGFLAVVHKAPWGNDPQVDYDVVTIEPEIRFDHWYEIEEDVTWSVGAGGRYKLTVDGRVVVDRKGPTMHPFDPDDSDPYGPQFGFYAEIDPPIRNEIIFGGINITLT